MSSIAIASSISSEISGHEIREIADGDLIHDAELFDEYRKLRGSVYLECGFIENGLVNDDGKEILDSYDAHSLHIAHVSEDKTIIGGMRLILRTGHLSPPLPVEEIFNFDIDEEQNALEVSRFIAHSPGDRVNQAKACLEMIGFILKFCVDNNYRAFSMLESPHLNLFRKLGLELSPQAPEQRVKEYGNTLNGAYEIDIAASLSTNEANITNRQINGRQKWKKMVESDVSMAI